MKATPPSTAISSHLAVRKDWLARRREDVLEPDLPIIDPHHHLIDRPESGTYLLSDLLQDIASGHNVVATVYLEWLTMYRADGPAEMRPVGEIEFANGVAAMTASGGYGKTRVCAGIVGHADLPLGGRVAKVLEAMIAAGGGRFCTFPHGDKISTAAAHQAGRAIRGAARCIRSNACGDRRAAENFSRQPRRGCRFQCARNVCEKFLRGRRG